MVTRSGFSVGGKGVLTQMDQENGVRKMMGGTSFSCYIDVVKRLLQFRSSLRLSPSRL